MIRENAGGVYVRNWKLHAQAHYQFEYPHNLFLEVFSEPGAPIGLGLVLELIVIGVVLVRPARTSPTSIGVLALLASETANVSVSGDTNGRAFWFLFALAFLVAVRAKVPEAPAPLPYCRFTA